MLSMNYVGGSAILDRGDGPAQAILDKNARSLAQRVANETKEELEKVMNRVENIYDSYESSTQAFFETQASMEYVDDIAELEELIKDSIKKKKYQQQITIFIVGYENVCGQKLRLLQQVNEFFMDNTRKEDEEDLPPLSPDIDVEDCSNKIEESLETAKHLADRLAEINSDIVDWLTNYAINKASTKAIALVDAKGKKKLESALSKAKEDMKTVTEQLKAAQAASEEKDDLVQLYLKQLEGKSLEIQKFKTAAEVAKKTIVQLEEDLDMNQVNLSAKQERIKQLSNELKKAQLDVSQSNYLSNLNENRAQEKDKEFMDFSVFKVHLEELQNQLERNKFDMEAKKRELQNAHEDQMRELLQSHKQELETLRADNETQINQLKAELQESQVLIDKGTEAEAAAQDEAEKIRQELLALQLRGISQDSRMLDKESTQITEEEVEKEESKESRPSTKTNKAQGPPKVAVRTNQQKNIPPKSTAIKNEAKVSTKPVKETAEPEPIEENVPEKPAAKKTGRSVETISDGGDNFNDNFDLNDEQAWTSIPSDQVTARFSQYRKLAKKRLEEMEEQLNITMTKTQRKVSTLKSQFHEHKSKWEAERKVLVEQVEQAQKLQNEAEKEADVAMTQLEEFINEQERLEEEEEVKRQEVVKGVSRPIPIPSVELEEEKSKSSLLTPQEKTTPEDASSDVEAVAKEIVDEADGAAPTQPSQPEAELSNLMQQTDDAKYERQKTDHVTSQSRSVRSSSLSSDVAPWLMSSSNPQKSSPEDESEDDEEELEDEVIEPPPKAMSKASIRSKAEKIAKERSRTLSATDDIKSGSRKSKSGLSSKLSKEESSSSSLRRRETTDGSKSEERDPDYMDDRAKSGKQSSSSPYSEKHSDQKESRKSSLTVEAVETSRSHSLRSRKKSSSTEETQEDKRSRSRSTRNRSRSNSRTTGKSPMTVEDIEDVEGMKSARSVPRSRKHSSEPVFEEEMEGHSSRPLLGSASHSRVSRQSIQHPSRKPSHISNQDQLSGEPTVFNSEDYEEDPFIEVNVRGKQSSRAFSRTSQGQVTPFRSFSEQVQEMNSRITSGAMSAPPEMDALSRSHSEFKEAQKREGTQTSLKSLPALDTLLWSSQSQRLVTSQQKSGLASSLESASKSAPLDKLALHMARSSISQKLESADKSFATVATDGSFVKDLSLTPVSRSVTLQKQLSRVTESRAGAVQEEADTLDGDHDNRIYKLDKACSPMTELYTTPIHGKTEDEIHLSSSMSRASLRNQYKNKLEEVRAAVEDRRAKSPAVSIPSQRSLEEDQLIDEDDGATGRAATDEAKEKRETSKLSRQKTERLKANHPAVGEFLKTYQGIVQFKEAISKLMVDREMLQPGQIVSDLETLEFDPEAHVEPQLEYMSQNVYKVLEEILTVLGTILLADREPNISSLSHVAASREPSQFPQREKSADSGRGPTTTRASQYSNKSSDLDKQALQELQEQYQKLQQELTAQAKKHEDQLRHNTVVMMEMQDTINELHRELSNLGRSSSRLRPQSDANSAQGTESSVMFTRLDSERNAKIMKRAVNEQKLAPETYKDAVNKMDDYVSLPAERLAHLVRKYVHHCRMKQIEDNVKKSRSLNENVFDILDKMEALQNQRAKRWADSMDEMGSERARLAALLMQTLESIEQESGIFLIKPMYSYRGREITERLGGKLARPNRPRHASPKRESINVSQNAPAPTPSHNTKGLRTYGQSQQVGDGYLPFAHSNQPLEGDQQGIMGNSMMWAGGATPNKQTWSMNASIVRGDPESFLSSQNPNLMNTPRILELDINRMMIGQNNISSKVLPTSLSDDRLINAAQNNLRSYVTVNRPTANQSGLTTNRPSSYGSSLLKEGVLPSSPINQSQGRARTSDPDLSRNMTNTPPLPPISTHSNNIRETPAEPPRSPPGSSIRVSPPRLVCL